MKSLVKDTKALIKKGEKNVQESLSKAYQAIDKAAKRGVIKKNAASRKKSRLMKALKKATS